MNKTYKRDIWLYDRGDYNQFRHKLSQVNWDQVFVSNNVNECAEKTTDSIINVAKESISNKTVTVRPSELKWINSQIKREIRKKGNAYLETLNERTQMLTGISSNKKGTK